MRSYAKKRFQEEKEMRELVQQVTECHKNSKIAKEKLQKFKQSTGMLFGTTCDTIILFAWPISCMFQSERSLRATSGGPPPSTRGGTGRAEQKIWKDQWNPSHRIPSSHQSQIFLRHRGEWKKDRWCFQMLSTSLLIYCHIRLQVIICWEKCPWLRRRSD